ncbi:MAG: hypothetical protein ACREC6_07315 [Hyphomicrobiaceae bacterium]
MRTSSVSAGPSPGGQAVALLLPVVLWEAARLARSGDLNAAGDLIVGFWSSREPDVSSLDLLARIRAQQGAYSAAESLWQEVCRLAPNHRGAQAALERLRKIRRNPYWLTPAVAVVGMVFTLAGIGMAAQYVAGRDTASRTEIGKELHRQQMASAEIQSLLQQNLRMITILQDQVRQQQEVNAGANADLRSEIAAVHGLLRKLDETQSQRVVRQEAIAGLVTDIRNELSTAHGILRQQGEKQVQQAVKDLAAVLDRIAAIGRDQQTLAERMTAMEDRLTARVNAVASGQPNP